MSQTLNDILDKHREFAAYLDSIDVASLRESHTRAELKELSNQLYAAKTRSIGYELTKLTEEMKKQEYPELLGVHHFPVIREIDFLSEEQKKKLDDHLVRFRKGNYVSNLWNIAKDPKAAKMIESFLLQKGIVEERFYALCPKCDQGYISTILTAEEKQSLENIIADLENEDRYEMIDGILDYTCMECDHSTDPEEIEKLAFKAVLKMAQERDTSLDNV